ncbi:uncharacterized protein LOC124946893 [Vespa velutina]|uniref:uncharacterized protein LOC124946893 n=1 Tax=Vespa velutina TaxID=202808 RepID=UPI001FB266C3|nr:uncharacterized protein LOC124946893 [Vespa velutina]
MDITIVIIYLFVFFMIIILEQILTNQPIYKSFMIYYSMFLHIYGFMIEFLLVIEFFTIVKCIKSEFERANELLADISMLPVSSIISELFEHREADGSFSIERSLPVDSKKLFIVAPSLRQRQSQLQISSYKINRSRMLLRTIRLNAPTKLFIHFMGKIRILRYKRRRMHLIEITRAKKIFHVMEKRDEYENGSFYSKLTTQIIIIHNNYKST